VQSTSNIDDEIDPVARGVVPEERFRHFQAQGHVFMSSLLCMPHQPPGSVKYAASKRGKDPEIPGHGEI
jgi:hypothetical protein